MTTPATQPTSAILCNRCHLLVDAEDHFCRHCGKGLQAGYGFFYSHTGVILMAIVLGPFVLPWVWLSKQMGITAKIIYSVVLILLGAYIVWAFYTFFKFTQDMLQQMLGGFNLPTNLQI